MKQQERILLTILTVGLSLLLIIRDVFGVELSKFIYFAYTVVLFAIAKYRTMVYMLCFILPLVCGLPGTYIMPCALVLLFVKKMQVNAWQLLMLLFVTVMEILASFWYPDFDLPAIVQYVSFAGVLFFLIHDKTELDYLQCIKMYMYGVSVLCGVILITGLMMAPSNWLEAFAAGQFRFGETQTEELEGMKLALNANSMAYYSITGICCGILLIERIKGKNKLIYICLLTLAVVAGFLTISRSWVLVAVICLGLYILNQVKHPKRLLLLTGFLVIAFVTIGNLFDEVSELLEGFVSRFSDGNVATGGGRFEIFLEYMEIFTTNLRVFFLGAGVTQFRTTLGCEISMHNGTQQILVCYGVFGFVCFVIALVKPALDVLKSVKKSIISWLPLIGIVAFTQTIQFLNPYMLMLPYIIGIYALKAGCIKYERLHHYN